MGPYQASIFNCQFIGRKEDRESVKDTRVYNHQRSGCEKRSKTNNPVSSTMWKNEKGGCGTYRNKRDLRDVSADHSK